MPKVTQLVCMEPTHKPKESDPSIGSLNNYCEMAGADQCCLVSIFCNALFPFLFLIPSSAPASNRGCFQKGEWVGRVETRSLNGMLLGTHLSTFSRLFWVSEMRSSLGSVTPTPQYSGNWREVPSSLSTPEPSALGC